MKKQMLINAVHLEQKRMAIVEDGKLVEFNIQMAVREPITGNIYKGLVMKVERGLQAAFVNYGGKKDGFLPLKDVSDNNYVEGNGREGSRPTLKTGQEVLVQILREVSERKGALLTAYISLPGRYLVLRTRRAAAFHEKSKMKWIGRDSRNLSGRSRPKTGLGSSFERPV
jgi:ribonuclease E